MEWTKRLPAVLCLCLLQPALAGAEEPEPTEYVEPVTFDELIPGEAGKWEVQLSVEATQLPPDEAESDAYLFAVPHAQLLVGLTDRVGVELDVPLIMHRQDGSTVVGMGDVELAARIHLLEKLGAVVDVVGLLELHLPFGDAEQGLGAGQAQVGASLGFVVNRPVFTWQGTLGYLLYTQDITHELDGDLSMSLALPAELNAYLELSVATELPDFDLAVSLGPGLGMDLTDEISVTAGALFGVSRYAPPFQVLVEVQHEF
jgi:hypothetical protein